MPTKVRKPSVASLRRELNNAQEYYQNRLAVHKETKHALENEIKSIRASVEERQLQIVERIAQSGSSIMECMTKALLSINKDL